MTTTTNHHHHPTHSTITATVPIIATLIAALITTACTPTPPPPHPTPGDPIYSQATGLNGNRKRCTIGVVGDGYIITAGHCTTTGEHIYDKWGNDLGTTTTHPTKDIATITPQPPTTTTQTPTTQPPPQGTTLCTHTHTPQTCTTTTTYNHTTHTLTTTPPLDLHNGDSGTPIYNDETLIGIYIGTTITPAGVPETSIIQCL